MGVKFSNNGHSTLAASITSSDTSITVASGHGARFPSLGAGDYFYATLIDASNNLEIVKCTARSSDVLTVTRGQESTTARAYAIADRIELRVTAQGITDATDIDTALPSQTSNSGKYLTTDGTNSSWGTVTPYSLPSQTGNAGKVLTTDGTNESWGTGSKFLQAVHYHATSQNIGKPGSSVTAYTAVGSSGYMAITPLSTTSKILITGGITVSGGSNFHPSFMMQRDNSDGTGLVYVYGDNTSSSLGGVAFHGSTRMGINSYTGESADDTQKAIGINIIDSHNSSTTAIRYRLVVRELNGGSTGTNSVFINRTGGGTSFADYTSHTIITLMEIEV